MELRVNGHVFSLYSEVMVNLAYNSIASTFSYKIYYDPKNPVHVRTFRPGSFHDCTIVHEGLLVLTGVIVYTELESAGDPPRSLATVAGFTRTGVLEHSNVLNIPANTEVTNATRQLPPSNNSEFNTLTLPELARTVCAWYGIKVVVDAELAKDPAMQVPVATATVKDEETVKSFLDRICKQKNVILSHTPSGNLLLTRQKAGQKTVEDAAKVDDVTMGQTGFRPVERSVISRAATTRQVTRPVVYEFAPGKGRWTKMKLVFDGQEMPRIIRIAGQDSADQPMDDVLVNPYVSAYFKSYQRREQSSGDLNNTALTARSVLGDVLQQITLQIEIEGWKLDAALALPNTLISVVNPEIGLRHASRWFVRNVMLKDDNGGVNKTGTLVCVLPECFNGEEVKKNVFA